MWSNTVNIKFDKSASEKKKPTDWPTAEKVHNTLCSIHLRNFIWRALKNWQDIFAYNLSLKRLWQKGCVCPDRDVLLWAMCSYPKCVTYISQVYSPSINVRKPWKYVNFAVRSAWASALRFSAKLHIPLVLNSLACAPNRQSTMK